MYPVGVAGSALAPPADPTVVAVKPLAKYKRKEESKPVCCVLELFATFSIGED